MEDPFKSDDFDRAIATDRPMSPIENVTSELETRQGDLFEAIVNLGQKLAPIMQRPYDPKAEALASISDAPSKDTEAHSRLVRQLSSCANRARSMREIVEYISMNIEV